MAKIEHSFLMQLNSKIDKNFRVIIALRPFTNIDELEIKEPKILMENILVATITGKQILQLSENINVETIEQDSEMYIL